MQQKTDRPTFVLRGQIASSPAFQPPGREGISRLASSVADYGSAKYPFAQRRKATDEMGAFVDTGQTFSAQGEARDFEQIVDIVADGEAHPTFADPWFGIERSQLANSLQSESNISGVMIDRAYDQLLLASDDPSLRNPTPQSVNSITRDDLLSYTGRYWRPDLATIAVVGDVTPQRVRAALEAAFGSWQATGSKPDPHLMAMPAPTKGHDYIGTAANQVFIRLGQPAVSRSSPDYDTFLVFNQILGGSGAFESRLWQELRQKRGLVYSVNSTLDADADRGDFRIELSASPQRVVEAVKFVRAELEQFQNQPVSATELQEAKIRLVSDALLDEASSTGQAKQLLDILTNGLPLGLLSHAQRSLRAHHRRRRGAGREDLPETGAPGRGLRGSVRPVGARFLNRVFTTIDPTTGDVLERFEHLDERTLESKIETTAGAARLWATSTIAQRCALLNARSSSFARRARRPGADGRPRDGQTNLPKRAPKSKSAPGAASISPKTAVSCSRRKTRRQTPRAATSLFARSESSSRSCRGTSRFGSCFARPRRRCWRGNAVLLKHAENTTRCGLEIERVFRDAGAPNGLLATLLVSNERADALIADDRIAAVTLTGSERAGIAVASAAGAALKKCVLELGGSDAFVVLADADLEPTVAAAVAARFQNNGQSCIAAKRFIVVAPVYDEFLERFRALAKSQRIGNPTEEGVALGPCARADLRDGLDEQVRDTVSRGGSLDLGGRPIPGPGFFYEPTIVSEVVPGMRMFDEEVFGPAAAVVRARDGEHAIALSNASSYGLGFSIWTRDTAKAEALAQRVEAGAVFINGIVASDPRLPFGGVKRSGYGRELFALRRSRIRQRTDGLGVIHAVIRSRSNPPIPTRGRPCAPNCGRTPAPTCSAKRASSPPESRFRTLPPYSLPKTTLAFRLDFSNSHCARSPTAATRCPSLTSRGGTSSRARAARASGARSCALRRSGRKRAALPNSPPIPNSITPRPYVPTRLAASARSSG